MGDGDVLKKNRCFLRVFNLEKSDAPKAARYVPRGMMDSNTPFQSALVRVNSPPGKHRKVPFCKATVAGFRGFQLMEITVATFFSRYKRWLRAPPFFQKTCAWVKLDPFCQVWVKKSKCLKPPCLMVFGKKSPFLSIGEP